MGNTGGRLPSEMMVVAAPMSFAGSYQRLVNRLWRTRSVQFRRWVGWWLVTAAVLGAWAAVALWYLTVWPLLGLWLATFRLFRRSQRTHKVAAQRHREMLAVVDRTETPTGTYRATDRDEPAPQAAPVRQLPQLRGELPRRQLGPSSTD